MHDFLFREMISHQLYRRFTIALEDHCGIAGFVRPKPVNVLAGYRAVVLLDRSNFSNHLVHQLMISPICKEVMVLCDPNSDFGICDSAEKARVWQKLRGVTHENIQKVRFVQSIERIENNVPIVAFFVLTGSGRFGLTKSIRRDVLKNFLNGSATASVDHLSLVASNYSPDISELEGLNAHRISIFEPSLIIPTEENDTTVPSGQSILNRCYSSCLLKAYPLISQFLPTRFREIYAEDLALAMRLNAELCAPSKSKGFYPTSRVLERLGFADCMQIIGRDDKI